MVVSGPLAELEANEEIGMTGAYVSGRREIVVPAQRRVPEVGEIVIHGAREHNLQDVTVAFPLDALLL